MLQKILLQSLIRFLFGLPGIFFLYHHKHRPSLSCRRRRHRCLCVLLWSGLLLYYCTLMRDLNPIIISTVILHALFFFYKKKN